jgi:CubicO group peptidase (beta-lactamase class C family)
MATPRLRKVIIFALLIGILSSNTICQTAPKKDFSALEATLAAELAEKKGVGAAIAIVRGNEIVFSKGFGAANVESGSPVTPDTLFQTGSVTKPLTAALILSLVDEGRIRLDRPIETYVKGLSPRLGRVTLAQLLTHTAGLLDEPDELGPQDESLMGPYIRSWKDDYVLFDRPIFSYSNSGFALAGFTASEAAGKPYTVLMQEKVFGPVGMKTTTFQPTVAMTYPLAVGHRLRDGKASVVRPLPNDARFYPAGPTYTSVNDLAQFAMVLLNDGKVGAKRVISTTGMTFMLRRNSIRMSSREPISYGLGIFIDEKRGYRTFWHDGSTAGYTASMLLVPRQKVAVLIMSNTDGVTLEKTRDKALEIMINPAPAPKPAPAPAKPLAAGEMAKYTGRYSQPKRYDIEVFIKDGQLFIKEFGRELPLTFLGNNRFSFQPPGADSPEEIFILPQSAANPGFLSQDVWAFKKIN